jgi:hypothetical protein
MEDKNYYMTDQEMTDFLESIGGLENGYFPDRGPIKSCSTLEIGNGWFGLVKELIEKCIAAWLEQTNLPDQGEIRRFKILHQLCFR